jgi:peptidoglycan hydrolase CwlO-like protein
VKNLTVRISVVVAVIGCVLAVLASVNMGKTNTSLAEERYKRISAEQNIQQANIYIQQQRAQLAETQNKLKGIEGIINQGQSTASTLKSQLEEKEAQTQSLQAQIAQLQQSLEQLQGAQAAAGTPAETEPAAQP